MPTQIIDGFKLNALTPIDSRMVTSGTVSRNNLAYKYEGLRVFDTAQKMPFVYIDGKWKQELEQSSQAAGGGGAITAAGKKNYLSKFDGTGLTNSVVREALGGANTFIGINIPISSPVEAQLHVGGVVKASSFCGNILGTFVNTGTLPLNKLCPPSVAGNYLLKYTGGQAVWGTLDATATSAEIQNNTTCTSAFMTFTTGTNGALPINVSCKNTTVGMQADLSNSQVLLSSNNGATLPPYAFIGASDTGMYGSTAEVGVSLGGIKRVSANSTKVEISSGGTVNIEAGTTYVQVKKNSTFTGTVDISGVTTVKNKVIVDNFQMTSGPQDGYFLKSDALGNAVWSSSVSIGSPIGTIVMYILGLGNIPSGWKPCVFFSSSAGNSVGLSHVGKIYINGAYRIVPNTVDRYILGSPDYNPTTGLHNQAYGAASPSTQQTTTLVVANLPYHKHKVASSYSGQQLSGTGANAMTSELCLYTTDTKHTHGYSCTPDGNCRADPENDQDTRNVGYEAAATTSKDGEHSHRGPNNECSYVNLNGYTDDGSNWHGTGALGKAFNNPFHKGASMIFIIKIDPNAAANTEGHYKIDPA
jgi:hypothetical protein